MSKVRDVVEEPDSHPCFKTNTANDWGKWLAELEGDFHITKMTLVSKNERVDLDNRKHEAYVKARQSWAKKPPKNLRHT